MKGFSQKFSAVKISDSTVVSYNIIIALSVMTSRLSIRYVRKHRHTMCGVHHNMG